MSFLYLRTKGWKTGKEHEIEIWYVEYGGKYYIVSGNYEKSHWVQNIKRDPTISFRVGDKIFQGNGRVVLEDETISKAKDLMNKEYKWSDGLVVELSQDD